MVHVHELAREAGILRLVEVVRGDPGELCVLKDRGGVHLRREAPGGIEGGRVRLVQG